MLLWASTHPNGSSLLSVVLCITVWELVFTPPMRLRPASTKRITLKPKSFVLRPTTCLKDLTSTSCQELKLSLCGVRKSSPKISKTRDISCGTIISNSETMLNPQSSWKKYPVRSPVSAHVSSTPVVLLAIPRVACFLTITCAGRPSP